MKPILTLLLLGLSFSGVAQHSRTSMTHTSIDDDDKTMAISVEGTVDGRAISYNRRFRVEGMSRTEKDALQKRVFDSLGIGEAPKPPVPPKPPKAPAAGAVSPGEVPVTFVCASCTGRMRLEVSGPDFSLTREMSLKKADRSPFPMTVQLRPGNYQYVYWQNGVQQMQLPFTVTAGADNKVTVK